MLSLIPSLQVDLCRPTQQHQPREVIRERPSRSSAGPWPLGRFVQLRRKPVRPSPWPHHLR
eukprot:7029628-Prorocentrum_lima.AAC.1